MKPWLLGAIIIAAVAVYFIPSILAALFRDQDFWSVFAVNLLVGWTIIGWAYALDMAVYDPAHKRSWNKPRSW